MSTMRLPVFDRRRAGVLLPMSALDAALGRGGRAFIDWLAAGRLHGVADPAGRAGRARIARPTGCARTSPATPPSSTRASCPMRARRSSPEFLAAAGPWLARLRAVRGAERARTAARLSGTGRRRCAIAIRRRSRRRGGELAAEVARIEREQYAFHVQWKRLREHAQSRGVRLFGDLPFYVAPSSVETWAHRDLFQLDRRPASRPRSAACRRTTSPSTGQLWGNPVYDWQALQPHRLQLVARARARAARSDSICCASITSARSRPTGPCPAGAPDARSGAWLSTPGEQLLRRLLRRVSATCRWSRRISGSSPRTCWRCKNGFALPGMRVLQFAFDGDAGQRARAVPARARLRRLHRHARQRHDARLVRRASTATPPQRVDFYLRCGPAPMPEALIRAALGSVARARRSSRCRTCWALARRRASTLPGTAQGNWLWRLPPGALTARARAPLRAAEPRLRPRAGMRRASAARTACLDSAACCSLRLGCSLLAALLRSTPQLEPPTAVDRAACRS